MKKNDISFSTPSRQDKAAILIKIAKFARGLLRQFWIIIPLFLIGGGGLRTESAFLGLFIFFGSFSLALSIIEYFRFYYHIENDELVIKRGVIRKLSLSLPLERIQSINLNQGILHQFFKVTSVQIDSAGSQAHELEIDALPIETAEALKSYILSKKAKAAQPFQDTENPTINQEKEILFRLRPKDLVKIGISENHLQTAGIILLFIFGLWENFESYILDHIYDWVEQVFGLELKSVLLSIVLAGMGLLLISFFLTLFRTVLNEFNLRFWKTNEGFGISSGLINRKETSALLSKIQLLRWSANPIQRGLGINSVRISQAASSDAAQVKAMRIPGVYNNQLHLIIDHIFGNLWDEISSDSQLHPVIAIRRFLLFGILPAIVLTTFSLITKEYSHLFYLALLPLIYWVQRKYHANFKFEIGEKLIKIKRGVITHKFEAMQLFKIQAVEIVQSPYQQRRDLATVVIFGASRNLRIPYIPINQAMRIKNTLLFRIENNQLRWM